jgi:ribose 5-phosphate isomerase RpiB
MSSIAIGADDAAFELKEILAQHMRNKGYRWKTSASIPRTPSIILT